MWGCVVKAPSAWLTYIGSLPLTSHHSSSAQASKCTGTKTHTSFIHHSGGSVHWCLSFTLSLFSAASSRALSVKKKLCRSVWNNKKRYKGVPFLPWWVNSLTAVCGQLKKGESRTTDSQRKEDYFERDIATCRNDTALICWWERWCWPGSGAKGVGFEHQVPGPGPDCHCPPPESHAWWPSCSPQGRSWQSWPLRGRWPVGKSQPPQLWSRGKRARTRERGTQAPGDLDVPLRPLHNL